MSLQPSFSASLLLVLYSLYGETHIPPDHPFIRYTGRVDKTNPLLVRFDWPGITIETRFEGTSCAIGLENSTDAYNVFIDGHFACFFETATEMQHYELISGLPDTIHHLLITKRFETDRSITACSGFFLDDNKKLHSPPPPPPYRIEYIGASTMIGYGNESKTSNCQSISEMSNCYDSYGPVTARMVNAEYHILAMTRRGLVRNYHCPFMASFKPFPPYYSRTLWTDPDGPEWNANNWIPHIIVITLGINDFSTNPHPTRELFTNHYYAFVRQLANRYPHAHIICLTPTKKPFNLYTEEFVNRERREGNDKIHFMAYKKIPDWHRGCNWHPNVKAHRKIAEQLVSLIQPILATIDTASTDR